MRTNVYTDGFNFYYGSVKGTPYRWLDLGKLGSLLLPTHAIKRIRYFTALVHAKADDPRFLPTFCRPAPRDRVGQASTTRYKSLDKTAPFQIQ